MSQEDLTRLCSDCSTFLSDLNLLMKTQPRMCVVGATFDAHVPTVNTSEANIIKGALSVDNEPKKSNTTKTYIIDNGLKV